MLTSIKFTICTMFLAFGSSILAQDWIQRNPLKSISDVTEMHVSTDQTIFALDATLTINSVLVSTNNGEFYRNSPSLEAKDMHMLNDNVGFLVASDKLIKTNNKFKSVEVFSLDHYFFSNVYFLNENVGYVSGKSGRIHKTSDGGQTWAIIPTNITNDIYDHYFIDENIGFIVGENRTLLRTSDGGNTWAEITLPIEEGHWLNKILFINSTQGIIVGNWGRVFNTSDAGITWTEASSGTTRQINDVKYFNGKYVAVCNNGIVLQSTDLGATWSSYEINYWRKLYSVAFSNSTIYIGSEAEIFQSTDNGATWTTHLKGVTLSSLNAISFANDNTGLVVGKGETGSAFDKDIMLRTTDGGINWEEKTVSGGYYGIHFLANGKALTSRFNISKVGFTSDFGETWSTINGPTITQQYVVKAVWLKSENDFFVGGGSYFASDGLYRYQNGVWTHNASVGNVTSINFLDDNFGILGTITNKFYKTTDGGDTWTLINYHGGYHNSINLIDSNTFYIGNYITTDGGTSFEPTQFPGILLGNYKFFDANYALALTSIGSVYRTLDAGNSWQLLNDNIIEDPNCCNKFYISKNTIIAIGNNSDIYTLDITEPILSLQDFENTKNKFNVYPNPASDKIFIRETNTTASSATIYNINGQKIKDYKLFSHQNGLDISDLTSGIYFMHIKSDSQLISVHRIIKK